VHRAACFWNVLCKYIGYRHHQHAALFPVQQQLLMYSQSTEIERFYYNSIATLPPFLIACEVPCK
jgi:hypothetical protein